jgi:hypothetical protein
MEQRMPILINCPSCGRKLRVPDELLGKKVRCPGCQTMFAGTPEPAAPVPAAATTAPADPPAPAVPPPAPAAPTLNLSLDDKPAPRPRPLATPQSVAPEPLAPPPAPTPAPPPEDDFRACPYCGEHIRREAIRCRFCGEDIDAAGDGDDGDEDRAWEGRHGPRVRRDCEPHRGQLILIFGIVSLASLAICGVLGLPFAIIAWVLGHRDMQKMDQGVMDPEGRGITQAGKICGMIGTIIDSIYLLGCLAYIGFIFVMIALGK